jgi:hypothetical protein
MSQQRNSDDEFISLFPERKAKVSDISANVNLENWVTWPKNTFQNLFDEALRAAQIEASQEQAQVLAPPVLESTEDMVDSLAEDLSGVVSSISRSIALQIYKNLPFERISYLVEYEQLSASHSVLMHRMWGGAIESAKYQWFIARDIFSYIFKYHLRRSKPAKQEALGSLVTRALLVFREIISLCEAGFPDGALARWRTLHELYVILLASIISKADHLSFFLPRPKLTI